MTPSRPRSLSDAELRAFHEQGYVILRGALDPDELAPVIAELDAFVRGAAADLLAEGRIADDHAGEGFETQLVRVSERTALVHRALFNRGYLRPALFDLLRSEAILDLVEPLVGPEIMSHSGYRIRPKVPPTKRMTDRVRAVAEMPWHQDAAYLEPACDGGLYVTVWTPLTVATRENGCVEVLPGGHTRGVLPHRNVRGRPFLEIPPEALPPGPPLAVVAEPGDLLLMGSLMPHRSGVNTTSRVRWSLDLRYHHPDLPQGYAGEVGFLARSRARPGEVVTSCAEYQRMRAANAPEDGPRWRRWPVEEPEGEERR